MTVKERASCINTIKLLQRLAFNVHGVMDVIDAENCDKIIKMLEQPTAQQWIPCSERLPEYGQPVLTWDGACYFVEKRIPVIRDDNGEPIEGDWWVSDDYDEYESDYYPNLRDGASVAWMHLPEPWEGEQHG